MSKSPPRSPPPQPSEQIPLISNSPNPNLVTPQNDTPIKSQPSTPEFQNPPPKSPINQPLTNPDQETHPIQQKSNLLVNIDQEQQNPFQETHSIEQKSNLLVHIDLEQENQEQDCDELDQANQEEQEEEIEDEEGINMSHSPLPKSSITKNSKLVPCSTRRIKKRKKISNQRKIQVLTAGFKPIPFVPSKFFDFFRHEKDLKNLGLWEFVHVEFDTNVRVDLLVQLIANYRPKDRVSYVNDWRVKVSRPDMGRALKLPVLPVKKLVGDCGEGESFSSGFISFLEEFVSSWMLLMEGEVWVTPEEIVNWMNMIKDGQLRKVDWAGIIWFMIEKELAKGKDLKYCYYASHLQQLIKYQREDLLAESENLGVGSKKVEEVNVESDEEEGDTEMLDAKESSSLVDENQKVEECTEIRVGQKCVAQVENVGPSDNVEKENDFDMVQIDGDVDMVERVDGVNLGEMDGEASKLKEVDDLDEEKNENIVEFSKMENIDNVEFIENEEDAKGMSTEDMVDFGLERDWLMDGMNDGGQHIMQRCSMTGQPGLKMLNEDISRDGDGEDVEDEVGEDDDDEHGFNFMGKSSMDIMTSRNLIEAVETGHRLSYNPVELGGQSSLGLMPSTSENDVMLNGQSMFNHVGKREIDHDHDFSHPALNDNHKRMKIDGHWDQKPTAVGIYMNEIIQMAQKAKMADETEKYKQENMLQFCNQQVAEKEMEVMQWRCKFEELQRKMQAEVNRRDRELHLMDSVIDGYRKALKDSQRAFAEYRKRCCIPDEPIYKDAGNGGVVKSIMELEKEQIKREEERKTMCYLLEDAFNTQIIDYESKWEELRSKVMAFNGRLINAGKEVGQLKDDFVQSKMSANVVMSQEVQSEAQEVQSEAQEVHKDDFVKCEMSEDVVMSAEAQNEGQEVPKDGSVECEKTEDDVMPEEVQSEAQGS